MKMPNGWTIFLIVVWVLIIGLCTTMYKTSDTDSNVKTEFDALVNSRQFIEKALVSPATAEFDNSTKGTYRVEGNTFRVKSFVDSQNAFGAMIRTHYSCRIKFLEDGRCYVDEVKIE